MGNFKKNSIISPHKRLFLEYGGLSEIVYLYTIYFSV